MNGWPHLLELNPANHAYDGGIVFFLNFAILVTKIISQIASI